MQSLLRFCIENTPTPAEIVFPGALELAWAFAWLALAGLLKRRAGFPTGYSRKVFHFGIFFTAAMLQWTAGTRAVCLFGAMTTLVLAYALLCGSGNLLYEAVAREKDAPHRSLYIVVPYVATLIGGVLSTLWFGPAAIAGFLVTGFGDAIGEPVGTRFGQHQYRVPSMRTVPCTRSWEGSLAVLVVSIFAVSLSFVLLTEEPLTGGMVIVTAGIGFVAAVCEAVSPHGWDNATMQLVPSLLVSLAVG